jgi:tetratricopeptide (TPR) repeat protein
MARSPEQRWQRAVEHLALGQMAPARAHLEALQAGALTHVRTPLLAARIAWHDDRIRDADRYALAAAEAATEEPAVLCDIVEALLQVGEVAVARECLGRPALARTESVPSLLRVADFRQRLDENAEALALIERAMRNGANDAEVRFHYGVQLYFNGRLDAAEAELEASIRAAPTHGRAALALARLRPRSGRDDRLERFAAGLGRVPKGTPDHAALLFARYQELEDLGRHEEAWHALAAGNAVMRVRNPFDAERHHAHLERLVEVCRNRPGRSCDPAGGFPQPIFIFGMPRSGTTVLERMLGNHSAVACAGELVDFGNQLHWAADTCNTQSEAFLSRLAGLDLAEVGRRYLTQTRWRAGGKRYFIDKQPPNWVLAGLIHVALPQARMLHLVRDPMDLCFSNWRTFFGDTYAYSYDLAALASYHEDYRRTMSHWHATMPGAILDVPYAELVRDPEAVLCRVFDFCGLERESGCTEMRRNPAPVATLSAAQVRGPLHADASSRWRPHAAQLAPLREALNGASDHAVQDAG